MSQRQPLQGACSCGRNHYSIVVPTHATEQARVYFDDSNENRRTQATPLTAWLRVPLTWYSSSTEAHFPDETHTSIRRIFTPSREPHCKRIFCGYCGTHLSYWTEYPASEAEYLNITLGSLFGEHIRALQELDLLPEDMNPEEVQRSDHENSAALVREEEQGASTQETHGRDGDLTWFEEMIDGSRLGRAQKKRRAVGISADGTHTVQWEITEYQDENLGQPTIATAAKRKIGDLGNEDDIDMKT